MADFSRDAVVAPNNLPVDDITAADPRAQRKVEERVGPPTGSKLPFPHSASIGVVFDLARQVEGVFGPLREGEVLPSRNMDGSHSLALEIHRAAETDPAGLDRVIGLGEQVSTLLDQVLLHPLAAAVAPGLTFGNHQAAPLLVEEANAEICTANVDREDVIHKPPDSLQKRVYLPAPVFATLLQYQTFNSRVRKVTVRNFNLIPLASQRLSKLLRQRD